MNYFRQNLVGLREAADLTWVELGERSGVARTLLMAVAKGESEITVLRAAMVARAFGLSLDQMVRAPIESDEAAQEAALLHCFRAADVEGKKTIYSVASQFGGLKDTD